MVQQDLIFGNARLSIACGDLFSVPTQSIVNSENTHFHLDWTDGRSVSARLYERFGDELVEDLLLETGGEATPPGTVLETSGYGEYRRIYHAGHHDLASWRSRHDMEGEEKAAHYKVLRACVQKILGRFGASDLTSVAFPLLGCGSFGLDPWLLSYEFASELARHVGNPTFDDKEVWLVVLDQDDYDEALGGILQSLSDQASPLPWEPFGVGLSYLDQFEESAFHSRHPKWTAWMVARYAELLTGHLFYQLAVRPERQLHPQDVMEEGRYSSFGYLRTEAHRLAKEVEDNTEEEPWLRRLAAAICEDDSGEQYLLGLNQARNQIAHGREAPSYTKMSRDVQTFIDQSRLLALLQEENVPRPKALAPWTHTTGEDEVGVFDQWTSQGLTYLVPHSQRHVSVAWESVKMEGN